MFKLMQKVQRREDGSSDLVTTILLLPLALFLLLSLIDVSMYFTARSSVQNETREGVRLAAMWGGTSSGVRLNNTGKSVQSHIASSLSNGKPKVTCSIAGKNKAIATYAGEKVACTTTYTYKTVTPGSDYFGFGAITGKKIVITETALTETGYR